MMLNNRLSIYKLVFSFVILVSLGTTSILAQGRNLGDGVRKELLQETFSLLDKLEAKYPAAQADLVKVRERIMGLYKNPMVLRDASSVSEPEAMYSRSKKVDARIRSTEWEDFYKSVKSYKNEELTQNLLEKIKGHHALKYSDARECVMLKVDNYDNYIECIYTGKVVKADKMPKSSILNIEHSWPQSLGAKGTAKSDMHHLFPTDPIANSTRSSYPFGEVTKVEWEKGGSKFGNRCFEPREKYRGNIARALFYFSVRYNKRIAASQEQFLKKWNKADPVDANEKARNDRVEAIQGNRNPFIDHPEFVDQIDDF